jgi:hypothetical protein
MNYRHANYEKHAMMHHWTLANHAEPHQLVEAFLAVLGVMACSVALIVAVYIVLEHATTYVVMFINPVHIQKAKHEDLEPYA